MCSSRDETLLRPSRGGSLVGNSPYGPIVLEIGETLACPCVRVVSRYNLFVALELDLLVMRRCRAMYAVFGFSGPHVAWFVF